MAVVEDRTLIEDNNDYTESERKKERNSVCFLSCDRFNLSLLSFFAMKKTKKTFFFYTLNEETSLGVSEISIFDHFRVLQARN